MAGASAGSQLAGISCAVAAVSLRIILACHGVREGREGGTGRGQEGRDSLGPSLRGSDGPSSGTGLQPARRSLLERER
jgi:hypothetical protein